MIGIGEYKDSHIEPIPLAWEIEICNACNRGGCRPCECGIDKMARPGRRVRISDEQMIESIEMIRKGLTVQDAADRARCGKSTMQKRLCLPLWYNSYQAARKEGLNTLYKNRGMKVRFL